MERILMTEKEMIADFAQELKEHNFEATIKDPDNSCFDADKVLSITAEPHIEILKIEFYKGEVVGAFLKESIVYPEDLIEYSWLLMRTGIFLKDLDRFSND